MTANEERLLNAALRLQEHRDRVLDLRRSLRRCERTWYYDDPDEDKDRKAQSAPCWKANECRNCDPEHGEMLPDLYCDACKANEEILVEFRALRRRTGGLVSSCTRAARMVRAGRKPSC